jgi:hypothetical protein
VDFSMGFFKKIPIIIIIATLDVLENICGVYVEVLD